MSVDQAKRGETALITGASRGIGAEFAKLLASEGYDLVLSARDGSRLKELASGLSRDHASRVEILPLDLAKAASLEAFQAWVRERPGPIDLLVNNAGSGILGAFAEIRPEDHLGLIQLNVASLTALCRGVVPGMLARKKGWILNVASTAAFLPGPLMAVYYATKAYVLSFTQALAIELEKSGVRVTCLCPGPTKSDFMERAGMDESRIPGGQKTLMDAARVARAGYQGLLGGKTLVVPGFSNKLLSRLVPFCPRKSVARVVRSINERLRPARGP